MIALIGLTLIIIAWVLQLLFMDKKKKIYASFICIYSIGIIFLVYDGFSSGLNNLAILNLVSLLAALAVLVKLKYY